MFFTCFLFSRGLDVTACSAVLQILRQPRFASGSVRVSGAAWVTDAFRLESSWNPAFHRAVQKVTNCRGVIDNFQPLTSAATFEVVIRFKSYDNQLTSLVSSPVPEEAEETP